MIYTRLAILYLALTAVNIALVFGYNLETQGRIIP